MKVVTIWQTWDYMFIFQVFDVVLDSPIHDVRIDMTWTNLYEISITKQYSEFKFESFKIDCNMCKLIGVFYLKAWKMLFLRYKHFLHENMWHMLK